MKKILCILLSVCMLLCMTACNSNDSQSGAVGESVSSESQKGDADDIFILSDLEKSLHSYYEWVDDLPQALVRSEHSCVTLGKKDAESYPEMAEMLRQIATMQENAMLDEFDNLVSIANDELQSDREGFKTYVSTLDVLVRRADSTVISLLSDSYSDFGQIENYRAMHGSNFDTKSGRELALNDIIKNVNNDLAEAVQSELTNHILPGEFHYEGVVEDYFANTPYDGFSWTVDYNGVTFYFAPGELCDGGVMTATVPFTEYPELFYEKYMSVPEEYTVELPLDISFFTNLEKEGALEEISVSGWYNDEQNHYMDYGVYSNTDGNYYSEECYVYDLHPYYVKSDAGNYVYILCEDFDEGVRNMHVAVLSLNSDGSITKTDEMNVRSSFITDNVFKIPTDPANWNF